MKILFFDLETTGVNPNKHGIIQLSCSLEEKGKIVDSLNLDMQPYYKAVFDPKSTESHGKTVEDVQAFMTCEQGYNKLLSFLNKHIDQFDKKDKATLCGFKNSSFDDQFLRKFFEYNGSSYFGSYFYPNSLDVSVLATQFLLEVRNDLKNFQLRTVAEYLGVEVDETKLHDADYDVFLTRQIYKIITL